MTSISKTAYIDKLDDIVNKYNNTYHRTIKMKLVDVKSSMYIAPRLEIIMIKILNLKLVILLEYQNIKRFFLQGYVPSSSEEGSVIRKVKSTVPWAYVISDVTPKKCLEG